jgi:hypothetical protein
VLPFDVLFDAVNRECGAIDQEQTRARRALLDWLRRLACRNSSVLRSLRGGKRNITKSLADRFWADDARLVQSSELGAGEVRSLPAPGPGRLVGSNLRDRRFTGGIRQHPCMRLVLSAGPMYAWRDSPGK